MIRKKALAVVILIAVLGCQETEMDRVRQVNECAIRLERLFDLLELAAGRGLQIPVDSDGQVDLSELARLVEHESTARLSCPSADRPKSYVFRTGLKIDDFARNRNSGFVIGMDSYFNHNVGDNGKVIVNVLLDNGVAIKRKITKKMAAKWNTWLAEGRFFEPNVTELDEAAGHEGMRK